MSRQPSILLFSHTHIPTQFFQHRTGLTVFPYYGKVSGFMLVVKRENQINFRPFLSCHFISLRLTWMLVSPSSSLSSNSKLKNENSVDLGKNRKCSNFNTFSSVSPPFHSSIWLQRLSEAYLLAVESQEIKDIPFLLIPFSLTGWEIPSCLSHFFMKPFLNVAGERTHIFQFLDSRKIDRVHQSSYKYYPRYPHVVSTSPSI